MDLPPELPCYNCGRMVSRSRKRAMPTLGLPDLPPRYYGRIGSEGAMRAISELGHVPRGTHYQSGLVLRGSEESHQEELVVRRLLQEADERAAG